VPFKVKRYVKRVLDIRTEDKHVGFEVPNEFGTLGSSWTEKVVCNPSQGDGEGERIGRKIRVKSLSFHGILQQGANLLATDDAFNCFRFVLAWWKPFNIAPCATISLPFNRPLEKGYPGGIYVQRKLFDFTFPMVAHGLERAGGDGYVPSLRKFKFYKRLNMTMHWDDDTTNNPDKILVLSMLSDSAAVTNPGFIAGYCCVTYEDA